VSELAADGIPVAVSLRVLKLSRQPYYRWLVTPVTDAELVDAHRANALFDAHRDDPEFGYRFLADEARDAGQPMCRRTAWRICSENRWWSAFGKKKARSGKKPGPPVHDDLVNRDFSAEAPNELWLGDITEHRTREGKLYVCAIKDVFSNRIVGYSIDDRMKSRIAVNAIESAVARRGDVAGCLFHSDRGSQGEFNRSSQHLMRMGVSDGSSTTSCRSGRATKDEIARSSTTPARDRTTILDRDCQGPHTRRGRSRCRRVAARGTALVPQCWRHATLQPRALVGSLPVVP
jgi:hypothetical protein